MRAAFSRRLCREAVESAQAGAASASFISPNNKSSSFPSPSPIIQSPPPTVAARVGVQNCAVVLLLRRVFSMTTTTTKTKTTKTFDVPEKVLVSYDRDTANAHLAELLKEEDVEKASRRNIKSRRDWIRHGNATDVYEHTRREEEEEE